MIYFISAFNFRGGKQSVGSLIVKRYNDFIKVREAVLLLIARNTFKKKYLEGAYVM